MLSSLIVNILLAMVFAANLKNNPIIEPEVKSRIVGGELVEIEDFPYIVSVNYVNRILFHHHFCGGSILSKDYILTAARCLIYELRFLQVRCGSALSLEGGHLHKIEKSFVHPRFNRSYLYYDVAVLKLETAIVFDSKSQPIKLVEQNEEIQDGTLLVVSGWGLAFIEKEFEHLNLRALDVPKLNKSVCEPIYHDLYKAPVFTEANICAGYMHNRKDTCRRDSGGPLVLETNEMRKQVGIVSYGNKYNCSIPGYPGVYTRIATVRDWIRQVSGL